MSLQESIKALKTVSAEAKQLFEVLKGLAEQDADATEAQKRQIAKLAEKLDAEARNAARARRDAEIQELTEIIQAHDETLTVPGLSHSTRDTVRAARQSAVARRGRLRAQAATDFGGILTKQVTDKLDDLVKKAKEDVARKKKAAAFLQGLVQVTDLALNIAGKLAM